MFGISKYLCRFFLLAASLPGYKIVHNRGIDVQRSLKKIKLKNFFRNYIGNFLV